METMRDIQIRLKSIDSTRQITESMRLISNRKVQKIKARMQENKPYHEQTLEVINRMMNNPQFSFDLKENAYIAGHKPEKGPGADEAGTQAAKSLVILITGDRGLCGGYNSNVEKEASALVNKLGEVEIIAIGTKGRDYFRRRQKPVGSSYRGLSENPFFEDAQNIASSAMKMFNDKIVGEIYLVYTEYLSMLTQKPRTIKLLPLDMDRIGMNSKEETENTGENKIKPDSGMSYDSGEEKFFGYAVSTYVGSSLFGAMLESAVCEQCARLTGMDSAVKNSKKIIDSLTLQYNQMRQSAITQEIAEIVGGANAVGKE